MNWWFQIASISSLLSQRNAHPFPDESQTDHCPRGGDILVADSETVLVGVSQRTNEKLGGIFRTWQNPLRARQGIGSLGTSKGLYLYRTASAMTATQ